MYVPLPAFQRMYQLAFPIGRPFQNTQPHCPGTCHLSLPSSAVYKSTKKQQSHVIRTLTFAVYTSCLVQNKYTLNLECKSSR